MALDTYSGLKEAVAAYIEDATIEPYIPTFITLAEARFRRVLVMPQQDTVATLPGGPSVTLPADLDSVRGIGGYPDLRGTDGDYAVSNGVLLSSQAPGATLTLAYRARLPALSDDNPTNWLLAEHPDLYLKATLVEAELYGWNDERIPGLIAWVDGTLAEVQASGQRKRYGSGPLVMRSSIRQTRGAPC